MTEHKVGFLRKGFIKQIAITSCVGCSFLREQSLFSFDSNSFLRMIHKSDLVYQESTSKYIIWITFSSAATDDL